MLLAFFDPVRVIVVNSSLLLLVLLDGGLSVTPGFSGLTGLNEKLFFLVDGGDGITIVVLVFFCGVWIADLAKAFPENWSDMAKSTVLKPV